MPRIHTLFDQMLAGKASDLHLAVGHPALIRARGELVALPGPPIEQKEMESLLFEIVTPEQRTQITTEWDLDFAYPYEDKARFRANYFRKVTGLAAVFRVIPTKILTLADLNCPDAIRKLSERKSGLIMVTGPTGSGKSTTLAAMINHINLTRSCHIITIEDPIEFVHPVKKSVIVHREVGEHTESFAAALKGAMRHDPDILLLGEMREMETIKLALGCASMGMLVFGTLHTNNAAKTVDRIINTFPADEQNQVRVMLSSCLAGVVAQLLCKRIPKGRCAVHEILLTHEALPNTIRSGQIANIKSIIESGGNDGMITMDHSLMNRVKDGTIEAKEAYLKAANKAMFAPLLQPGDLDGGH